MELRIIDASLSVRESDGAQIIRGFIPYNRETVIGGWFREVFRPGAFAGVVDGDTAARFGHSDILIPLGRTTATPPTLRLEDSPEGLRYEIDPPDTTLGRDLVVSISRGDIKQTSFAFATSGPMSDDETWTEEDGELPLREVKRVSRLQDVAPVVFGAYGDDATVSIRAAAQESERIFDEWQSQRAACRAGEAEAEGASVLALHRAKLQLDEDELNQKE